MTEIGQSSNTTDNNNNNGGVSNNNSNDSTIPFDSHNYADTISTKSVNYYYGQRHILELNEKQVKVLKAICGTLVGCLDDAEIDLLDAPKTEKLREFGKFDLSDSDEFIKRVLDRLSKSATREKIAQISGVLKKLGTKNVVNSQITNHNKPFYELTRKQREQIISKWSTHAKPSIRKIYRTFTFFVCAAFWSDPYGFNSLIGYPGPDPDATSSRFTLRQFPTFEFLKINNHHSSNVSAYDGSSVDIQDKSRKNQISEPDSARIPEEEEELAYDVVVVGSGGGGSVIAAQLAKEGYEVLVVEKGHHVPQSELTLKQSDAYEKLYEMGGGMLSEDSGVIIHSGSNFGGGTTIGWSAASEPQHFVREEWARKHGLYYILDKEYSDSMKVISGRLGVSTNNIVHNESNKILIEGCKKLGLQVDTIPQCTASRSHSCGWCGFGCKYGEKQSAVMTWLLDAKNSGASFLQDCYVEKVLIDQKLRKVVGVEVILIKEQRKLKIRTKRVVLACGAIHTPALLLRSGLKNKNIGKNLHIHPMAGVYGIFPDKQVKTYSGSIMTAVSNFTENVDGNHYGSKIIVGAHHPAFMFANFPWKSTFQHKQLMLDYTHMSPLFVMVRDRDAGKVVVDPQGQPRVDYKISTHDSKSAVAGIIASLKILVAAGAKKVGTCQTGLEEFEIDDNENPLNDSKFQQYLDKVKKIGVSPGQTLLGSIHQMGTCCMGGDSTKSVVNPTGETWEIENLFVADSSIFPTATGVDPMITIMSIAYMIAKTISDKDSDVKMKRNSIKWPVADDASKRKVNNRLSFRNSFSNTFNGSFPLLNRKRDSQIE